VEVVTRRKEKGQGRKAKGEWLMADGVRKKVKGKRIKENGPWLLAAGWWIRHYHQGTKKTEK